LPVRQGLPRFRVCRDPFVDTPFYVCFRVFIVFLIRIEICFLSREVLKIMFLNETRSGEVEPGLAGKLGFLLNILRGVMSDSDLEARLAKLEEEVKKTNE